MADMTSNITPGVPNGIKDHLFVNHGYTGKEQFSQIVSHARRTQAQRKSRNRREIAKQDAGYARSLVGWRVGSTRPGANRFGREIVFRTAETSANGQKSPTRRTDREEALARTTPRTIRSAVDNGLRADPFHAFPSDNSREAMEAVDFYINIWSMYKRGAIDVFLGLNTQIDMCWPIALEDGMLFDATLTVSRVAFCLGHCEVPNEDEFVLKHKIQALAKLRERVEQQDPSAVPSEAIVFTVSRMLSISYMTLDDESFQMHFSALQRITQSYMLHRDTDDRMTKVVASRIKSWTPLFEYRQAKTGFGQGALQPSNHQRRLIAIPSTLTGAVQDMINALPIGFAELARDGAFSLDTLSILARIQAVERHLQSSAAGFEYSKTEAQLYEIKQELIELLATLQLNSFEIQLCYALLALVIAMPRVDAFRSKDVCSLSSGVPSVVENPPLERVVKAFLYMKYSGRLQSPLHNLCLQWCALTLGCCCFLIKDISGSIQTKGHIALVSITERLRPPSPGDDWTPLESALCDRFLWPRDMVGSWKEIYLSAMQRQRGWERLGLLKLGMPSSDKVEYLVLRDARGALPPFPDDVAAAQAAQRQREIAPVD